jgi:hypothetical protein
MQRSVAVVAQPSCLDATFGRVTATVEPGATIAEMIDLTLPQAVGPMRERLRVTIGEHVILPGLWATVRPKAGTQVMIRAVPAGDIMRNVLTIAVTVGALATGQFYAAGLAEFTGLSAGIAQAAITGTTLLAGTLLINALVPPRSDPKNKPTYSIQGMQNQYTPDGVVPLVLGFVRYAPPYAAKPYTKAVEDYRYITAAFCCGYGPLAMRNWRIGDTPIERFFGMTLETHAGTPQDPALQLYPTQVIEEPFSIALQKADVPTGGPEIRVTAADTAYVEVDITFASGLYAVDSSGAYQAFQVDFVTSFRKVGTTDWMGGPGIPVVSKRTAAITRSVGISFPERGRYEVQIERLTTDWDEVDQTSKDIQRHGRSSWSAMRSFRPEYPINFDKPRARAAVNILATGQLNGMLDSLNADMASICPDYDEGTQTWISRETNNPASLFRYVLAGPAISYPLGDDEIGALADWHTFCAANGLVYNRVHDYEASVLDVLSDIAAAGRASPQDSGTAWGVVVDRALDVVSAHISPRNSWGFEGQRSYVTYPDGYRVSFLDETNEFQKAERVVPWPGFVGSPSVIEALDLPGITDPYLVWKEARRRQYEVMKRPDIYTVNQDIESLTYGRGDRVQLSNDVLDRVQVSARVVGVSAPIVYLDEYVSMQAGQIYHIRFRRADGTTLLCSVDGPSGDIETNALSLRQPTPYPAAGDLAFFGLGGSESRACTVKGIEAMDQFTARITLVDHAPEIEALVAAEVPPVWSGRAGANA